MPLPLKASIKAVYVFRRAIKKLVGYEISPNERISYAMIAGWVKRLGELIGIEVPIILYNLRYNTANAFNRSSVFPAASALISCSR